MPGREPAAATALLDLVDEVRRGEQLRRDVHRTRSADGRTSPCHAADLPARLAQHEAGHRHDQPGLLRHGDELGRRDEPRRPGAATAPAPRTPRISPSAQRRRSAGRQTRTRSARPPGAARSRASAASSPWRASPGRTSRSRRGPAALARYIAVSASRSRSSHATGSRGRRSDDADARRRVDLAPFEVEGLDSASLQPFGDHAHRRRRAEVSRAGPRTRRRRAAPAMSPGRSCAAQPLGDRHAGTGRRPRGPGCR